MKIKKLSWLLLFILLPISIGNLKEITSLNLFSIQVPKTILAGAKIKHPIEVDKPIESNMISFHFNWLDQFTIKYASSNEIQLNKLEEFLTFSPLYMHMIKNIYPTSRTLAEMAVNSYPIDTIPLYWLLDSMIENTTIEKKQIYEKILSLNPKDGVAWRRLGLIYIAEKNIPAAIDAHINSCFNGDPGSNGCYRVGQLLEKEGRFEEAIYYYRLSRFVPSLEAADRLETELSTQNP